MAATILAYDIPGSSMTASVNHDYRAARAIRRFLVDGNDRTDKSQILEDVRDAIRGGATIAGATTNLHVQKFQNENQANGIYTAATEGGVGSDHDHLPLQTMTIQKVGQARWIVEAVYYYNA